MLVEDAHGGFLVPCMLRGSCRFCSGAGVLYVS